MEFLLIAIAILVVALIAGVGLLVGRGRNTTRLDDDAASVVRLPLGSCHGRLRCGRAHELNLARPFCSTSP